MRSARTAAYLFGGVAALGAAAYLVVYLYRWQWQRTLLCGVLLLVIEVLLLGFAMLDRLGRLERRARETDRRYDEILALLRAGERERAAGRGSPERAESRFSWLEEERTHVFVPVLMAAGAALSGLAWVVERLARATTRPLGRRRLAGRLVPLSAPTGGAHGGVAPELAAHPPIGPPRWRAPTAAGVALALCVGLYAVLAELTETRPPERGTETATSVLFTVTAKNIPDNRADLAAHQTWERCRDATSIPLSHAGMAALDTRLYAATVHPSLSDHDRHRLIGCLQDAGLDRVQLTVLGTGAISPDAEE
ncbi:tropomyosin [Streptomyces sedi]|uniref:Tropomyosin n=1 Tax=Streptomyces sedi TaxID=555059 RepID=A0A5C4VBQ9_9ACTN|nr:tropomyosin [Streptomyces sedi]TNM32896.1 tropomyosin [Streptomyces sedi]